MRNKKTSKGITLIALVITIIVLLILAGVSIAMLTRKNGIITQAQNAKNKTAEAEVKEKEDLEKQNDIISNAIELPSTSDTRPFLPEGSVIISNDLKTGVTIKDSNGNEWVWIEVPKSIYTNTEYNGGTAPTSSEDYAKIESTMQKYAKDYRVSEYEDTWYSEEQHGFKSATDYNNHKNSMLKSTYENGGFYIGKYETGTKTLRNTADAPLETPVIQEGAYPYNYVTCKQAQEKSKELATGRRTSSLMFGIQWDLVMKHIETKGKKEQAKLKEESTEWGNYYDARFDITKGKYSEDEGNNFLDVTKIYTKQASKGILLTTGATKRNSVLNVYDLAGNVWEWTLERSTSDTGGPWSKRGGNYGGVGRNGPASYRISDTTPYSYCNSGYRTALW